MKLGRLFKIATLGAALALPAVPLAGIGYATMREHTDLAEDYKLAEWCETKQEQGLGCDLREGGAMFRRDVNEETKSIFKGDFTPLKKKKELPPGRDYTVL
jgi:hypothetical protein